MYAQRMRNYEADPEERQATPAEAEIARKVLESLQKDFPGYPWTCSPDLRPNVGMIYIRCTAMEGGWGINLKASTLNAIGGYKVLRTQAGELIERFKLRTDRYDPTAIPLAKPQR